MTQEVNPDWTEAIKRAMHNSVLNTEVQDIPTASSVPQSPPVPTIPTIPLLPKPSIPLSLNFAPQLRREKSWESESNVSESESASSTSSASVSVVSRSTHRSRQSRTSTRHSITSERKEKRKESQEKEEEQEKYELLSRIQHLQDEKGYKAFRKVGMQDSIHDVRYEFFRAQRDVSKKSSVQLMKKYLVTFTSLIEKLSEWYNPLNLKLSGYSKSILLSMKDYEPILEELHFKYSESMSMAPELKLVLALTSSMFFYHAGHNLSYEVRQQDEHASSPTTNHDEQQRPMSGPKVTSAFPWSNPVTSDSSLPTLPMPFGMPGANPMAGVNFSDIMSGLNMVQTLMKATPN